MMQEATETPNLARNPKLGALKLKPLNPRPLNPKPLTPES